MLPTIARAFGVDERNEPLLERLTAAVRSKQVLLVIDNLEHVLAAGQDVLALLAECPGMVVLATSRVPLRVRGEREYRVAPLELAPEAAGHEAVARTASARLFLNRVQAAGVDLALDESTSSAVAAICRRLDGAAVGAGAGRRVGAASIAGGPARPPRTPPPVADPWSA